MTNVNSMSVLDAVYPFNFQDTDIRVLDVQGRVWLTAADLSRALGYAKASKVSELYQRNKDEFTEDMTTVITLQTNELAEAPSLGQAENLQTKVRIFSTQGCHLIAMFSRTDRAKAFRRWVLSVLGGLDKKDPPQKKRSHFTEFGKADILERVLSKATEMTLQEPVELNRQRLDKLVQERADELVKFENRLNFGGARLLIEPNGMGGFNTRTLKHTENVLCDSKLADYIADWRNGPATYFLPAIMEAVAGRMVDMCNLPFVERDHEQN